MAFHPMRTFQKNRKFWMATILLVCMVTFVLCTGSFQGGDFGEWIMRLLGRRSGYAVTTIDGRTVYSQELHELKTRRDIANAYMRDAIQLITAELKHRIDEAGKMTNEKERAQTLQRATYLQRYLADKLARPRYFRGGTKLEDLLDFLIWRNQADRLNIRLNDATVAELIASDLHAGLPQLLQAMTRWGSQASAIVQRQVRGNFPGATYRVIVEALTDEFRVHTAQLMLEDSIRTHEVVRTSRSPGSPTFEEGLQTRMAPTPEEIYNFYVKHRNEAEIALIPLRVEKHLKDSAIPKPTEDELARFFKRYKDQKYDPASRDPGFQQPEMAQVRWLTADPKSKFYTTAARLATTFEVTTPWHYQPQQGPVLAAVSYLARSAAWEASLARNYENLKRRPSTRDRYEMAAKVVPVLGLPFGRLAMRDNGDYIIRSTRANPYFALPLYKGVEQPRAVDVAALLAGSADPAFGASAVAGYQAAAYFPQAEEMAPVLEYERKKRGPLGATVVLTAPAMPLAAAAMQAYLDRPQFLPLLGPVKKELRERIETGLAQEWARLTMYEARERLEANKGEHTLTSELRKLQNSGPRFKLGLQEGGTTGWRSPYDIGDDPGMAALKKSYEHYYPIINSAEGRGGTAGMLHADDFDRLFFGAESFGVGNIPTFYPQPWPPTVTIKPSQLDMLVKGANLRPETKQLFNEAEQPFLFWRTAVKPAHTPTELGEIRAAVEHAWRLEKARALMGPKVKAVADALVKAEKAPDADLWLAVRDAAKAQKEKLIVLHKVAPLVEETTGGELTGTQIVYEDYKLPPGKIQYPRDDTAKQVLALRDLKEPLKVGIPEMDKLNQELFKATKDSGHVVQILTNKPQTVFYVASLVRPAPALPSGFMEAYRMAGGMPARNLFVERCQSDLAQQFREELMRQLRAAAGMTEISAEARKEFVGEGPNR